jgi:anti-sigma-K factor RskA
MGPVNGHHWFVEHRMEYATRTLDDDDLATFEVHLANCEECRAEVARIEKELAWLPLALPPAAVRPGLRRRIVQHALGESRVAVPRWLPAAVVAAGVLLAAGGWLAGHRQVRPLETELAALRTRATALADTLSVMRRAVRVLQAQVDLDGGQGGLVIFADDVTHRWSVVVHGLPPAPAGTGYQFWFICTDGMVRGSALMVPGTGSTMFTTGMPESGGAVLGAALTLEPVGVSTGPPRGKELVHLML